VEKKSVEVVAYVNNLSRLFRLILINSREEFISLSDELATIESYLTLQSNFSKKFDFTICVSKEIDQETIVVPPMLIQPLIENAINHGLIDKTDGVLHIKINKSKRHDMLICKIRDNGKGYSENENKGESKPTSISGDIIRERIKILKSKFELDLKLTIEKIDDKGGTEASLYLPYLID
jgi:LytS/YehU family sensor histidine kinase